MRIATKLDKYCPQLHASSDISSPCTTCSRTNESILASTPQTCEIKQDTYHDTPAKSAASIQPYTAKRQSHHLPVSFQTPQWRRRIQYVISLSSLMVLPTLNAHATRPKILENFAKFHWISPFCMVRSRKKQCYVT